MKYYVLEFARPMGPKPVIYEETPPTQYQELVWDEERQDYLEYPWSVGNPIKFETLEAAYNYFEGIYKKDEIKLDKKAEL